MKLKKKSGYRLHQPLSFAFSMKELGGSYVQKYNSIDKEFNPDRTVTPYVLKPQLIISDPDGAFPTGDYSSRLVSVKWRADKFVKRVKQEPLSYKEDKVKHILDYGDYTVDTQDHTLTYKVNTGLEEIVILNFSADFIDTRRTPQQVQHFEWSKSMSSILENPQNVYVTLDVPSKLNLSPFKRRSSIPVSAVVYNGGKLVDNSICLCEWQHYDEQTSSWVKVDADLPWLEGSGEELVINVLQDYIGRIRLRCIVTVDGYNGSFTSPVTMLRRWYGQYEEDLDILQSKYIYADTTQAQVAASVQNRQGNISKPCRYFDIAIYYPDIEGNMQVISHTTSAVISRKDMNDENHVFGITCRELSQLIPIADENDCALCDGNGNVLFAQFPMTDVEK